MSKITAPYRDWTQASRETLEILAEVCSQQAQETAEGMSPLATYAKISRLMDVLHMQCPLPRTEAQIDRDLVRAIRTSVALGESNDCLVSDAGPEQQVSYAKQIRKLCNEKFRP